MAGKNHIQTLADILFTPSGFWFPIWGHCSMHLSFLPPEAVTATQGSPCGGDVLTQVVLQVPIATEAYNPESTAPLPEKKNQTNGQSLHSAWTLPLCQAVSPWRFPHLVRDPSYMKACLSYLDSEIPHAVLSPVMETPFTCSGEILLPGPPLPLQSRCPTFSAPLTLGLNCSSRKGKRRRRKGKRNISFLISPKSSPWQTLSQLLSWQKSWLLIKSIWSPSLSRVKCLSEEDHQWIQGSRKSLGSLGFSPAIHLTSCGKPVVLPLVFCTMEWLKKIN